MVAFMDAEALEKTRETGLAHFHSRSRNRLWMKGETSGHVLHVQEILVDCDQDALVIKAQPAGPACHTGAAVCFYRRLDGDSLVFVEN
jgi:phosphoribosyl-AMP cyclohydrolase